MRVVHVHRMRGIGGSERHLLTLLPALAERGLDVAFVVLALLLFAYQSLFAAIFVGATRYRISFDFLLVLLAAAAASRLAERVR